LLQITTGASDNGFVEISVEATELSNLKDKIVISGAFELLNVLKNVEE
jgi:hypothetical protein